MPGTGVLLLSQYLEPVYALRLVERFPGGVGYLLKDRVSSVSVLIDALQRVADGECVIDPSIVSRLLARPAMARPLAGMTPREARSLLAHMAEGRSNAAIGAELYLGEKTVEGYIRRIFDKLGLEVTRRRQPPRSGCHRVPARHHVTPRSLTSRVSAIAATGARRARSTGPRPAECDGAGSGDVRCSWSAEGPHQSRTRVAQKATAAADATLSESTPPAIGMRTTRSDPAIVCGLSPSPSAPRISASLSGRVGGQLRRARSSRR